MQGRRFKIILGGGKLIIFFTRPPPNFFIPFLVRFILEIQVFLDIFNRVLYFEKKIVIDMCVRKGEDAIGFIYFLWCMAELFTR